MADNNFQEIIDELQRIHDEYPDLRFGSVIQVAIDDKRRFKNSNLKDVSSKVLLKSLQDFNSNTKKRRDKQKSKEE